MDVGRSDRAARSGRDGFLEGGGKGSQTLSLWVKKKQNVWSEENDIAMVLGVGHYSWGSIRSTSPECAWHQRLWLELRAQGCGGGACVTEGRWNKAVGTLHSETRKRVTEDPVVGGGGQVGHGLRGQWKQGQNSANRTPVVWRRERLQEERSHRSLCPLLTLHCFWQLYLCYGFSFTLSHLSFPPFFFLLPASLFQSSALPSLSVASTLWPFVSTSSESRWCFLKCCDKLTGQPSIERGTEGADQWKASLRTTVPLNFLRRCFNVYWRDGCEG